MADVYGTTLKLDDSMDIIFDGAKRLMEINDIDKVKQDLEVLFRTHLGDDIFNPSFGLDFDSIVNVNQIKNTIEEIRLAAQMYKYTDTVLNVAVRKVVVSGIWKEYWDVEILLLSEEQIKITFGGDEE